MEIKEYGIGQIIRRYSYYPDNYELPCHWEHGWTSLATPLNSDMAFPKDMMLVFNRGRYEAWKKTKSKRPIIFGSPFVQYRRLENIKRSRHSNGTLAFPSHSCEGIQALYNLDRYCEELQRLPEKFQPVTVCLHPFDVGKGMDVEFEKRNIPTVTAGDALSSEFPGKFYEILTRFNYTTSNIIGSYTFYSIDLGIPFFLHGNFENLVNDGSNPDAPKGKYHSIPSEGLGKMAYDLFNTGPSCEITEDQKRFAEDQNGIKDAVSRAELSMILYQHLLPLVLKDFATRSVNKFRHIFGRVRNRKTWKL